MRDTGRLRVTGGGNVMTKVEAGVMYFEGGRSCQGTEAATRS